VLNEDGHADAIIVARGGGSLEELWPFNEEVVARAIHASAIPVISGVGHERDVTVADLVADVRAPTPTAAAEMAVPNMVALSAQVSYLKESAWTALSRQLHQQRQGVASMVQRIGRSGPDINLWRRSVDDLTQDAWATLTQRLRLSQAELAGFESRVRALDPVAVLARGYAIVEKEQSREAVTSPGQVADGDPLRITLSDGTIPATVGATQPPVPARRSRTQKVRASARLL
jgi:exodeoxyribonuclease VII large subunit